MAYYDALISAWNTSTAAAVSATVTGVAGVAGQSLNGLTTAQKIAAVNGWTVTGTIPTSTTFTGAQLANCINWTEFAALTATQQSNLLALCQIPGGLLGGSANASFLPIGMILAAFTNASGPTRLALVGLANALVQPWWSTPVANGGGGLGGTVAPGDASVAGLT
jgi:hypothetical protein